MLNIVFLCANFIFSSSSNCGADYLSIWKLKLDYITLQIKLRNNVILLLLKLIIYSHETIIIVQTVRYIDDFFKLLFGY